MAFPAKNNGVENKFRQPERACVYFYCLILFFEKHKLGEMMKFLSSSSIIILLAVLTACHSNHSSMQKSNSSSFSSIQTGKINMPTNTLLSSSELLYKILEFINQTKTRQSFQQENAEQIMGLKFTNTESNYTDRFFTSGNTINNHVSWKIWTAINPDMDNPVNYMTLQFYQEEKDISDFTTAICQQMDVSSVHQKLEQQGMIYQMKQHLGKWVNFYTKNHDNGYTTGVFVYYINADILSNNKQCIEKIIVSFYKSER